MTLTEILQEYRIPFKSHGEDKNVRHGWLGLHCPICARPDDKYYLGWSLEKHFFSCWSCGYLRPAETLAEIIREPVEKCRKLLYGLARPERPAERPRGKLTYPKNVSPVLYGPHKDYLRARGFDPKRLERLWRLGSIGIAPRLAWRIFIPIISGGDTVSWTTRTIGNCEPRYISAEPAEEAVPHRELLYGADYVRHAVIVHEGPADVWATGPGAVALCGLGFSPAQVLWLSRIPRRIICFDSEPAAQRRAGQLCDQLGGFGGDTQNVVLDAKDAGSATRREILQLRGLLE